MKGFTDIHAHFVYGVDDGAADAAVMRDMLDASHRQGVARIFATSHAEPGMRPFDMETYSARLEEGRRYCAEKGYDLTLVPGAELLYTPAMDAFIQERRLIPLGETAFALVEFVPDVQPREIEWMLTLMGNQGYRPILAHIERYACMQGRFPAYLKREYPVLFQVNCRTVLEKAGWLRGRRVQKWFESGLVDFVASDMHNTGSRPTRMAEAYEALLRKYGQEAAEALTCARALKGL